MLALPFRDESMSVVVSQATFEHVRNPFQAAAEIWRVLEPGGRLYVETAFMQPVHAAPFHYFNMTTWGAEQVFKQFTITKLEWAGELSKTIDWLMGAAGLHKINYRKCQRIMRKIAKLDPLVSYEDLRAVASGLRIWAEKPPR
jgi:ubiquinone/menaquinone biosynthesis C-methylase UbiE